MGFHTFDPAKIENLEDESRFRYCSREELLQPLPTDENSQLLDIGSGTGFYTDEISPFVGEIVGLDVQRTMHRQYREKGVPDNVRQVTAEAGALPFAEKSFDAAVSTMTFHESTTAKSLEELYRVLDVDAPVVVVDWSGAGSGEAGPPVSERYDADRARTLLSEAGFKIQTAAERPETFAAIAVRPR